MPKNKYINKKPIAWDLLTFFLFNITYKITPINK